MKKKKVLLISLLFILLSVFTFNLVTVRADSGWDTDYDFGGWDSGGWDSDWDSDWGSSSYDSDWGFSYIPLGGIDDVSFLIVIFVVIICFGLIKFYTKMSIRKVNHTIPDNTEIIPEISEEEVKKYMPDFNKEEFLNNCYQKFIDVQNAWSEFDYDKLRSLLTDELYNSYHTQLVALKAKKQKNLMEGFDKESIKITNLDFKDNKLILTVNLIVWFYDYVVDKDNNVVRGTKNKKIVNSYNLVFISTTTKKKKTTCPSCGAPVSNDVSNICEYCKSNIVFESHDWILSKKEIRK